MSVPPSLPSEQSYKLQWVVEANISSETGLKDYFPTECVYLSEYVPDLNSAHGSGGRVACL